MDKSYPKRISKYYSSQQLQAQDISGDCNTLWSQKIKLKYQHPNIYPHQGILKGKKLFNIARNSTEIKYRVTHLHELRQGALAIGTAGQRGTTVPLNLPVCSPVSVLMPIFFSPALQAKCRVDRFWIHFSFPFPCPHSDRGPKDKQNSQQEGNGEKQQEGWRHYNSQGMLRYTYDSS